MSTARLVGTVAGPLVGGVLTQFLDWRWCFFVNAPVCLIASFVATRSFPVLLKAKVRIESVWTLDFVGAILVMVATVLLMLALTWGGHTYTWSSLTIILMLGGSAVAFALFAVNELKFAKLPVFDLSLLGSSETFRKGLAGFFFYGCVLNTLPPFLVQVRAIYMHDHAV